MAFFMRPQTYCDHSRQSCHLHRQDPARLPRISRLTDHAVRSTFGPGLHTTWAMARPRTATSTVARRHRGTRCVPPSRMKVERGYPDGNQDEPKFRTSRPLRSITRGRADAAASEPRRVGPSPADPGDPGPRPRVVRRRGPRHARGRGGPAPRDAQQGSRGQAETSSRAGGAGRLAGLRQCPEARRRGVRRPGPGLSRPVPGDGPDREDHRERDGRRVLFPDDARVWRLPHLRRHGRGGAGEAV